MTRSAGFLRRIVTRHLYKRAIRLKAAPFWCLAVNRLASKEKIEAARVALKAYLTSSVALTNPHCLEAVG